LVSCSLVFLLLIKKEGEEKRSEAFVAPNGPQSKSSAHSTIFRTGFLARINKDAEF